MSLDFKEGRWEVKILHGTAEFGDMLMHASISFGPSHDIIITMAKLPQPLLRESYHVTDRFEILVHHTKPRADDEGVTHLYTRHIGCADYVAALRAFSDQMAEWENPLENWGEEEA